MEFKAFGEHVLIDPVKKETTKSGLILNDDLTDPIQKGMVLSAGHEADEKIKPGVMAYFKRNHAFEVELDGEQCLLVKCEAIVAINERETTSENNTKGK